MSTPPWTARAASTLIRPVIWLSILFALFQAGAVAGFAQAATNFEIDSTVQQAGAKRFGVNLASQNYFDSGQMLRNLTFMNPGFEGQLWQSVLQCSAASANSCQSGGTVWPDNFLQGGTFEFISGAANGQTGTIASSTSGNLTINFSAPLTPAPSAGDWVIVRTDQPGNAEAGWWTNTSGGGTLSTDTTDIAPDSPGKQALEISASGSGQSASVAQYFDSSNGRSFIQLNGTYTINFKAKGVGGNNQLNVSVVRLGTSYGNENFLDQNVNLTSQWQDYSYTFNAAEDGSYIGPVQVNFSVAGANIYLDDVALTESAAADNPTAFRNAVVDRLRQLRPGIIRYMDIQDYGTTIANVLAVPFARQRAGWAEASSEQDEIPLGLHEFLTLCQAVGAEPWYNVPIGMTTTEMQNLIQYLSGDASTPYGAIRAQLGQSAPWTSVFPVIHLEFGNEAWNMGTFPGEAIDDPVIYGQRAGAIFAAARATPGYNPSSFDLIMGSWAANSWWTSQEMDNGSGYDSVDAAPYLFDTFDDSSSNEAIYGPMFAEPEMLDSNASGGMAQQAAAASGRAKVSVYEVNLGTEVGTVGQDTVNSVVGSVGAGIAVADHMFLMLRDDGIVNQNMYALSEYLNGFMNTAGGGGESMPLWGSTIDMGGETNANRPTFLAEQLANSAILPSMLAVTTTGANPTWNQPLSSNDSVQLSNAHYLQSFAFTNGTQSSVVVFNLSRSGSLPVTFSGVHAPTGDVLIGQLTSANITDNNENLTSDTPVVNIKNTNVSNFNPATPYSLPPFSMTVFLWPGSTLPSSTTTLTANPSSGTTGQAITLTAAVTSQSGTNTPTGTVSFFDGATNLGTAALNATGVAALSTTALPAGTDSITASYAGDSNDAGSTSAPITVTITSNAVSTTTTLTVSPTTTSTGQTVSLTATVAPQSGSQTPSGNVNFMDGTTLLGTASLNASGVASFTTTELPAGADSITASYIGNSNDAGSVSAAVTVNVTQTVTATTTTLIASASQISLGQNVTFTATVAPQSGTATPAGTVTFLNGGTTLGTAPLNSNGTASISTTALPSGSNSITASYGGSSSNSASVSGAVSVTVSQGAIATTTTLTASPTAINSDQTVTFTAKVTQQSGGSLPTGTVAFLNGSTVLGTATLNASGVATLSTTSLPSGTDSITASYGGATGFNSSVSTPVTVTVTQTAIATTTSLSASATQISSGQNVIFTAMVVPQSGAATPAGTVTFLDGAKSLGTATLNANGSASFSTAALAVGSNSITASYGGSSSNSSSVSAPVVVTVAATQVTTTTTLTASAQAINTGDSLTLTATVAPQSGTATPAGTVTFLSGGTILGATVLNAGGAATLSTTALAAGTDSITASYGGSSANSSSTSAPVVVTVTQSLVATTTTLVSSATQIIAGQSLVLTATVAPQSGKATPAGTVTFLDGTTVLGTAPLSRRGTGSFSTSGLAAGSHTLSASYGGSSSNSASTSAPVTITVASAPVQTVTTLTSSATAIDAGQSVTFTATVTPKTGGGSVPILPVAFLNGSTIIGTANVNANGIASFTTTALPAGADSITASYTGNNSDLSSVSAPVAVTVTQTVVATTTSVAASTTQPAAQQLVTFTATVTAQSGGTIPAGTVTFLDGSTPLGTAAVDANGVAFFGTTALATGAHVITASYGGDKRHSVSGSNAVTVTVTATTNTALTASAASISTGQSVTFTATVTPHSGSTVPAGTVAFLDGSGILGTAALNANGVATLATSALPAGTQSITASYAGSTGDTSSISAPVVVVVTQSVAATTTTLASSASQVDSGAGVVFTAVVAAQSGATPAGTVTFLDGSTVLASGQLNASGTAFLSTTALAVGNHSITATYNGSASDAKSVSASVAVTVVQTITPTTTRLTASATQIPYNENVTLTAVVAPQSGSTVPQGTVAFLDGSTILATAPLNASGVAVFHTGTLKTGAHSITASYGGGSGNSSSVSSPVLITVAVPQGPSTTDTTTFLTASSTQPIVNQNVTFTAQVVPEFSDGIPVGTVTFTDGATHLGSVSLNFNGSASLSTSSLGVGTHSIVATYSGGGSNNGSSSSPVAVVVSAVTAAPPAAPAPPAPPAQPAPPAPSAPTPAGTATTLKASASQVTAGDPVSFGATVVASAGGAPAGTVQFLDGQTVLGAGTLDASGTASFTATALAEGAHSITASYSGDSTDAASTSAAVNVTVAAPGTPGYTLAVSSSNVVVTRGQVANLTVTLSPENGFKMPVNLACSGLPAGMSCSFAPPTVTPNGAPVSSTLSILAASPAGSSATAQNRTPGNSAPGRLAFGLVMPWGIFSLLGLSRRKNRSRIAAWTLRLVVAAVLVAGSLWISGCGYSANGSIFTMTLTSSGANVPTHTSQIIVNVTP